MEFKDIDKIIEKYLEGESTLEQEQLIREYFNNSTDVPEKHKQLAGLFNFYQKTKDEKSSLRLNDIVEKKKSTIKTKRLVYLGIAASIALFVSIFIFQNQQSEKHVYAYINGEPVENQEIVIAEAQKALLLISNNLNEGTHNLNHLKEFNKAEEIMSRN